MTAPKAPTGPPPTVTDQGNGNGHADHGQEAAESFLLLPSEFWTTRPVLRHIRDAAWHYGRCPDVALHAILARIAACAPYGDTLDTGVGSPACANYFVAIVGGPAAGKSTGVKVGKRLLLVPFDVDLIDGLSLGTGEGLAEKFMGMVPDPEDPKGKKMMRAQVAHHAFYFVDEGAQLNAIGGRDGATIYPTLRSAWMGETLGQANATADRNRHIPEGSYSLGVVIGYQPDTIANLLAPEQAHAGTPQRFAYVWATDPTRPIDRPAWPGIIQWRLPTLDQRQAWDLDDDVRKRIIDTDDARSMGDEQVAELDAHDQLMKVKMSMLLALLDERTFVTVDDWALAEIMWDTSVRVRDHCQARVQAALAEQEQAVREKLAGRAGFTEQVLDEKAMARAVRAVVGKVQRHYREHDEGACPRRCLHQALPGRDRQLVSFDAVVERAEADNLLAVEDGRFAPGKRSS